MHEGYINKANDKRTVELYDEVVVFYWRVVGVESSEMQSLKQRAIVAKSLLQNKSMISRKEHVVHLGLKTIETHLHHTHMHGPVKFGVFAKRGFGSAKRID